MVCHCEAPSARLASRMALGQFRMASSVTVIMVGNAIMASTMLPANPLSPTGRSNAFCIKGTITISPKKPYTTEGIPLSNSMTGFIRLRILGLATSDIYMATANPNGKAMSIANKLTHSVPVINGKKPNWGAGVAVGNHSAPAKTSLAEMVWSFRRCTESGRTINCAGTKAMIPGVCSTSFVMQIPAFS